MRDAYLKTLYDIAKKDKDVISLVADNGLIVYDDFRRDMPEQYFNFGISEGNMISAAAGMASCGKIPFAYTISAFLAYRSFEFIRDDVCFQNQNVKIIGIGSGMAYSTLGPSHHATEDISVLRVLPNLTLFSPSSPTDVRNIIHAAYDMDGPVYIRLGTNKEEEIYKDKNYEFQMGKGIEIKEGSDISIVTSGAIITEVIIAADLLEKKGIHARIINIHTLKPFDNDIIKKAAEETKHIFTVEEHNIMGGLGTIVAEVLATNAIAIKFNKIGLTDCFGKGYGTPLEVKIANQLDSEGIYNAIIKGMKGDN